MTKSHATIRNKFGLPELARQLGNVAKTSGIMGYSRIASVALRGLYGKGGEEALMELWRREPVPGKGVPEVLKNAIFELAYEQPAWGQVQMANEIRKQGLVKSPEATRSRSAPAPPFPAPRPFR